MSLGEELLSPKWLIAKNQGKMGQDETINEAGWEF